MNTSATHHQGIEGLEQAILQFTQLGTVQAANLDLVINQRQAEALMRSQRSLHHVMDSICEHLPLDFWSIDLRDAIHALGKITGEEVIKPLLKPQ